MPITFDCECGKTLRVPDEHAGRRVRCPACSAVSTVPAAEPQFEVVENSSEPLVAPPPKGRPVAKPAPAKTDDDDDDDDRAYGVAKSKSTSSSRDDDEDEEERPRKKKKKKPKWKENRPEDDSSSSGGGGAGVAGGALMMVIAVVWFVLGLMNDWVFFYPPILFILGLVALIKGLAGEE